MNALLALTDLIRNTRAEIARIEESVGQAGMTFGVELSLASMQRRLQELEGQFAEATAEQEVDVCSYRLSNPSLNRYPMSALGRVFTSFQSLFSVLYDVVKRGEPRKRANLSPESIQESSFEFGYAFQGSLGFIFTIPNERRLTDDSLLDIAMGILVSLPIIKSSAELSDLAGKYGVAPVRLAYQWAKTHLDSGLGVDLEWKRRNEVRQRMIADVSDLQRLTDLIAATSELEVKELTLFGALVGIDTANKTFHLVVDSRQDINGKWHSDFKLPEQLTVNGFYTALIEVQTRIHYATEAEERGYFLKSLSGRSLTTSGESVSTEGDHKGSGDE